MSSNGVDYGHEQQTYLTPQPGRARKSVGRRLSLGAKRAFKAPISPPRSPEASPTPPDPKSSNSFSHVSMLGEVDSDADNQESPPQITPEQAGGNRRRLKLGSSLRSTIHGDDRSIASRSVASQPRPEYKRGMSFTPKGLKKKFGKNIMKKLKSNNVQDPADREFQYGSDNSQASHFKGSNSRSSHSMHLNNVAGTETETLSPSERTPLASPEAGRKTTDNPRYDDDDRSEAGTIVSKSGRRRRKKKVTNDDMGSPPTPSKKKKTRSRSKSKRTTGDDVSVKSNGSRKARRASKSRKPKTKVNAWGEEVEEVSEDETYVHSIYGDDGSTSKPRRRRRKKKQNSSEEDQAEDDRRQALKKQMSADALFSKKATAEVEKRRKALEQELDAMLDRELSNHGPDLFIPPPPPLEDDKAEGEMAHPLAKKLGSMGSREERRLSNGKSPRSARRQLKVEEDLEDDFQDADINSQEDDLPPIRNLSFSQRRQRTIPNISLLEDNNSKDRSNSHRSDAYEYHLGDTTTDEDDDEVALEPTKGSRRRAALRDRDGNESVSSKRSVGSKASKSGRRIPRNMKDSDEMSTGGMSAGELRAGLGKKEKKTATKAIKKMDAMLDQLEKYETNLEDEQQNLRKKLESMAMEKEYLEQKNRQLEFRVEELKDKASETADRLDTADRNKDQSSQEIDQLRIENDILKQRVQRHEATLLRMNSSRSIRGMRSIINNKGEDPEKHEKELADKDKEITKLKADLALLRDQLRYKTEDYDKQAVELHQARKEVHETRTTLQHTGTFKYHNKFEKMKQDKVKNKSESEARLSSFFDD